MLNIGATFGRFTIRAYLGSGGFATVYRVYDTQLQREEALKIIHADLSARPDFNARFTQAMRAVAALRHPNLLSIEEVGEVDGHAYLALPLAATNLAAELERDGPSAWPRAIALLHGCAAALDALHAQGIVHGDLRPQNVLLSAAGQPLLSDAHLAITLADALPPATWPYMAPEVWAGFQPTPASDRYALACLAYELFTGRQLFSGPTSAVVRAAHHHGPTFPAAWPGDLPDGIAALLEPALARDPARRMPASGSALVAALEALRPPPKPTAPTRPWTPLDLWPTYRKAPEQPSRPGGLPDLVRRVAERIAERLTGSDETQRAAPLPPMPPPQSILPLPEEPKALEMAGVTPEGEAGLETPPPAPMENLPPAPDATGVAPDDTDAPVLGQPDVVEQERRVDAAVPSVVGVGQAFRLIAQVRFKESPQLGIDDWPTQVRPERLAEGREMLGLRFPVDPHTGAALPIPLRLRIASLGFTVDQPERWIDVPPDDLSPLVRFVLVANQPGYIPIDLEVYSADAQPRCLATASIDIQVAATPPIEPAAAQIRLHVQVEPGYADLELQLNQLEEHQTLSMQFHNIGRDRTSFPAENVPLSLTPQQILAATPNPADPRAYGQTLTRLLFAEPRLETGWRAARDNSAGAGANLRVHLRLNADSPLHGIRWETLCDPIDMQPLALSERTPFSRMPVSSDMAPQTLPERTRLQVALVVAAPTDLADFGLAPIAVDQEIDQARAALGDLGTTLLARHAAAHGAPTLPAIETALRAGAHLLYLVCHGSLIGEKHYVWLEDAAGKAARIEASAFVQAVTRRNERPVFVILNACRSAGDGYGAGLFALGPQLATAGVSAVLAFQGDVRMRTVSTLMPALLRELTRNDGVIDRAVAAARGALTDDEWWQAVLWLRTRDGRLWAASKAGARVVV